MLAVHCKRSEPVDLRDPILDYVQRTYGAQSKRDIADELEEVQQLRTDLVDASGVLHSTRQSLAKYFRILTMMESRFPISKGGDHIPLCFTWFDAFRNTKKYEQYNIHFEKAAIMFNLGAIQSQVALAADRKTEEGLKESAKFFQESAGSYAYLRDVACLKVESPRPIDLSPECATMLEKLMLAQAQECVLETATLGKKSPAILARLAKQAATYYDECARLLSNPPLNQHFDRSWLSHATVKCQLYEAEAMAQSGAAFSASQDVDGVAKEIARLRAVLSLLGTTRKEAKSASKELQEATALKEEAAATRLTRAEKENATVYLQRVPLNSDLPAIAPASLVKSVAPSELRPVQEAGMFKGVVPESSARSLSKYTDMVDALIRQQMEKLAAASDDARLRLREWELPEALHALDSSNATASLPEALRVELESVQDAGGGAHLQDLVAQIKELKRTASEELAQCEMDLDAEQKEDDELRAHYGARWTRTPSAQLTRVMRDKVAGYRSNMAVAGESDGRLEDRLRAELAAFATLDPEAAAAQMPRLQAPMLSVDNMEPATIVATLRQALESLSTLSSQRAALEEALKEQKSSDNILPRLMSTHDGSDALFKEELQKYDELIKEVDSNVESQGQVLDVLAHSQQSYRSAYGYDEWRKSCEVAGQDIRRQVAAYAELRDNLSEGLRFYTSLGDAIGSLRQQVGDYCMTRKIQRDDIIDDLRKQAEDQAKQAEDRAAQQMAAMRLGDSQGGGAPGGGPGQGPPPPYSTPYPPHSYGAGPPSSSAPPYGAPPPQHAQQHAGSHQGYGGPPPHHHHQQQPPSYGGYGGGPPGYPGGPPPPPYYQGGGAPHPPPPQGGSYPQQPTLPQTHYRGGPGSEWGSWDSAASQPPPPPAAGGGYQAPPPDWAQQWQR